MRIITTFNDDIYEASAKELFRTIAEYMDGTEILAYHEGDKRFGGSVDVRSLCYVNMMLKSHADIIPKRFGGKSGKLSKWNDRWFGWFMKVAVLYDSIVNKHHQGVSVFLDADVRVMRSFTEEQILNAINQPIAGFKGNRKAYDTGIMFYNEIDPRTVEWIKRYMNVFESGKFRDLSRWDDGFVFTRCAKRFGGVQDLAKGKRCRRHRNSNGHITTSQIIHRTKWGSIFEHDKGKHKKIKGA